MAVGAAAARHGGSQDVGGRVAGFEGTAKTPGASGGACVSDDNQGNLQLLVGDGLK